MNTELNLKNNNENYELKINETYNKLIDNIQNWCNITNEQAEKLWFDIQTFVEDTYKPNKSVDEYVKELENILFCTINPAWIKIAIENINEYDLIDETIEEDITIKPIIKFEYNNIIFSYVGPDKEWMLKTPDICELLDFMDIEQYAFNILFEELRKVDISRDEAELFIPIIYEFDWSEPLSALLKISDKNFYTKLPERLPIIKSNDITKFLHHFNFSLVY